MNTKPFLVNVLLKQLCWFKVKLCVMGTECKGIQFGKSCLLVWLSSQVGFFTSSALSRHIVLYFSDTCFLPCQSRTRSLSHHRKSEPLLSDGSSVYINSPVRTSAAHLLTKSKFLHTPWHSHCFSQSVRVFTFIIVVFMSRHLQPEPACTWHN